MVRVPRTNDCTGGISDNGFRREMVLVATRESSAQVKAWEETVVIPTYPTPPPDRNPIFIEKRVYQGSSGKVYPNPFTDRVSSERTDRDYRAVFMENDYVKVMILPEIGGRIQRGLDKT